MVRNHDGEGLVGELGPRLEGLRQRLGPRLRSVLDEMLARHHFAQGDLLHSLGQPIVGLPVWVADYVDATTHNTVSTNLLDDLVEASVVGYLYARMQDDFLDERIGEPVNVMMVADSLLFRHIALLARSVGPSERFWDYHEEKALAYADAMLLEHELLKPDSIYGPGEFELVLRRSAPLILSSVALLDLFNRWQDLPHLESFVQHVVRSGQLIDDLRDAVADFDEGNLTWVVRRMGGLEGRNQLLHRLGLGGGFGEIIDEAMAEVTRAEEIADSMGLTASLPWLEARRHAMTDMHESFLRQLFTMVPAASEPPSH